MIRVSVETQPTVAASPVVIAPRIEGIVVRSAGVVISTALIPGVKYE